MKDLPDSRRPEGRDSVSGQHDVAGGVQSDCVPAPPAGAEPPVGRPKPHRRREESLAVWDLS